MLLNCFFIGPLGQAENGGGADVCYLLQVVGYIGKYIDCVLEQGLF